MRFSNSGSTASGVTSRPVNPVPPVVMTTSIAGSAIQRCTCSRIACVSSRTMPRSANVWPADRMRSVRVAPDLSSASSRVSETVSTANFSGTNGFVSSKPGMVRSLELRTTEGVAARHRTALEPGVEPAHALFGRAVGECVGDDVALRLPLQAVVADGGRGLERSFDVALLDQIPALLRTLGPDSGKTIGLQLDLDLQVIRLDLADGVLTLLHLRQDAEQILHVVTDLVGDHVSLGELARLAVVAAAEPALQVAEERRVEIDPLVVGTIERPHGGARGAAGRARRAGEHHQRRWPVAPALLLQQVPPYRLGAAEHGRHELAGAVAWRAGLGRGAIGRVIGMAAAAENLGAADQEPRVDAERPAENPEHDQRADAHPAGADRKAAPAGVALLAAAILDVVAARQLIPAHSWLLSLATVAGSSAREASAKSGLRAVPAQSI